MAKKTAAVTARVDPGIKEMAEAILSQLGLSASAAVDMFYRQVIMTGGIPFDVVVSSPLPSFKGMSDEEIGRFMDDAIEKAKKDNVVFTGFDEGPEDD